MAGLFSSAQTDNCWLVTPCLTYFSSNSQQEKQINMFTKMSNCSFKHDIYLDLSAGSLLLLFPLCLHRCDLPGGFRVHHSHMVLPLSVRHTHTVNSKYHRSTQTRQSSVCCFGIFALSFKRTEDVLMPNVALRYS